MDSIFLVPINDLIIIFIILMIAFVIFSIAGFGTVLLSGPLLALYLPVSQIIPLIAILDFIAAVLGSIKKLKNIDAKELKSLLPFMIAGSVIGAILLFNIYPNVILVAFGIFAILYALYTLSGLKLVKSFSKHFAIPFGFIGGVFSALFGSGGFIYAIYLSSRIPSKDQMVATQKALIIFTTVVRILIFFIVGIYINLAFFLTILILIPAMLIGVFIGKFIHVRLSKKQFSTLLSILILLSGTTLIVSYFTGSI